METIGRNNNNNNNNLLINNTTAEQIPLTIRANISDNNNNNNNVLKINTSENYEFMEFGTLPPIECIPSAYEASLIADNAEPLSFDVNAEICGDTIRQNLIEQMLIISGKIQLLNDIEQLNINTYNIYRLLTIDAITKDEKNICFLWCAFLKHWELLNQLIEIGADIMFYDVNGLSALHLAAFSGCKQSLKLLMSKGIDLDFQPKYYTPLHCAAFGNCPNTMKILIENGANPNLNTKRKWLEESLLHCAVRVNAIECVKFLVNEFGNVNAIAPNGTNAIHLAADLGLPKCLKLLLTNTDADPNVRIYVNVKESTALHLAADEGNLKCINLLLFKGADATLKNYRGFTALHLAARTSNLECVESLLRNGNSNANAEDFDGRTPMHVAIIGKSKNTIQILETLLFWGANINHKDVLGITALHLAALEGLSDCVNFLLRNGADLTTASKKGVTTLNVLLRKTPSSLQVLMENLNSAITLCEESVGGDETVATAGEIEIEMDFKQLLKYCHPREINYLYRIIEAGYNDLLKHPLCASFLYLKWTKIRKYYIVRLIFYFAFVFCLSLYVLTALAHSCYNSSRDIYASVKDQELCQKQSVIGDLLRNNPFFIEMQWWFLVFITIFEIFRKLYGINNGDYKSLRHYVSHIENVIEWFVIVSVFLTSYIYNKRTDLWQNHVAAFAVLLGWTNLMLMIGQLPIFGVYVEMYTKVQGEFAKLFMAYSCMLIGFIISFCVVFPSLRRFENPLMGMISVLVMMVGEHDLEMLDSDLDVVDSPVLLEISAQIIFVLFHIFVTIILMNLLVGIAVDDIQSLKKTAELSKLVRQTKLIAYIEAALFTKFLPKSIRKFLHQTALISPQTHRIALRLKPLNPAENRIPHELLMAAFEIAKQNAIVMANVKNNQRKNVNTTKHFPHIIQNNISLSQQCNNEDFVAINNNIKSVQFDDDFKSCVLSKINKTDEKINCLEKELIDLKSILKHNDDIIVKLRKIIIFK